MRTAEESLLRVVTRYAPIWEPFQPGSFVLDVTGTGRLFGPACDVAAKVQEEVLSQYRLDGVAGVGSNKLIAQTAATLIQPSEFYDVRPGSEHVFMSPLSVHTLPGFIALACGKYGTGLTISTSRPRGCRGESYRGSRARRGGLCRATLTVGPGH